MCYCKTRPQIFRVAGIHRKRKINREGCATFTAPRRKIVGNRKSDPRGCQDHRNDTRIAWEESHGSPSASRPSRSWMLWQEGEGSKEAWRRGESSAECQDSRPDPEVTLTPKSPAMVYACAGWMGTKMRKVAPRPDVLSTSMKPPCSRTMP